MMAEDHEELDLRYLTEKKETGIPEAAEKVRVDQGDKRRLRTIKEEIEAERKEFTEHECKKILGKAMNLHQAAKTFVEYEDSHIAPGPILGLYHELAGEYALMQNSEVDEKIRKKTAFHFSKVIDTLAESDISAKIYRGNYEYDAASWDARAAEGQINHPEVDLEKAGEVGPYQSNLN